MRARIFRNIFLVSLASLAVCFSFVFGFGYRSYESSFRNMLLGECELISSSVEKYGVSYLDTLYTDGRFSVILFGEAGEVLFCSLGEAVDSLPKREQLLPDTHRETDGVKFFGVLGYTKGFSSRLLPSGEVIAVYASYEFPFLSLFNVFVPLVCLLMLVFVLSLILSKRLTDSIVKPLSLLNYESPERIEVYSELKPVVSRLYEQNKTITKQLSELSLRENEFNSITSNMSEGMIVINSRAEVLSCNRAAREIFEIDGDAPHSVLLIKDSPSFRAAIHSALSGKNGYDSIRTLDKFYSILATPVFHSGVVSGGVIVILDDTEKEHREQLRREFTSNISHELKTPLTSISGFAELIGSGMAEGEDARKFALRIQKEAGRLIDLVSDIIRLAEVDGGEIPYDEGMISLYDVCSEVVDRLTSIADKKNISLSLHGEDFAMRGNRKILSELVYNLVDNGIKYNNEGGYVAVSLSLTGGGVTLSVKDNGIGIPKELEDRVFERFFRVDKSHSKEIGGTGLGLSIVKHAVNYHKASIELLSEPGVGTEVRVLFPSEK